ncbi:hypothetical protein pipiens_018807 [Culex pipiens pipiens]|uniref:Uncharacterized protein n=1 Tax=Culex pipiens pipiens TaxID=38569 RepID=A0ABD1DY51_CULPP
MEPGTSVNPLLLEECNQVSLLHKAIKLQHEKKSEIVKFLIESNLVECDQRDADGKTATEVVLTQLGDRELAKLMVTAELVNLSDERDFYVMIRRGSVPVYKLFLECKSFDGEQIFRRVSNAMIELNARRVPITMEMEVFVQYQLAHFAHNNLYGDVGGVKDPNEWRTHFAAIEEHWQVLKKKFGDRNYANVDNEFLFRIKAIHNHLFFVKDKRFLKHLPVMEATFCLAILVSIFECGTEYELFKFLINKVNIMQYLGTICRQLKHVKAYLDKLNEHMNTLLGNYEEAFNLFKQSQPVRNSKLPQEFFSWDLIVDYLLTEMSDWDERDALGRTVLHRLIQAGNRERVSLLLEIMPDIDVNAADRKERTPLDYAIDYGCSECVQLLLSKNASVSSTNQQSGITPLHLALTDKDAEKAMYLLKLCVDQDLRSPDGTPAAELPNGLGFRPLHLAAMTCKLEVVRFLIDHCKVDLRAKDAIERVPVIYALAGPHMAILKLLLERDPEAINIPDNRGQTTVHYSAVRCNVDVIQMMLPYGVDLFLSDKNGANPVQVAMESKSLEWLKVVLTMQDRRRSLDFLSI